MFFDETNDDAAVAPATDAPAEGDAAPATDAPAAE